MAGVALEALSRNSAGSKKTKLNSAMSSEKVEDFFQTKKFSELSEKKQLVLLLPWLKRVCSDLARPISWRTHEVNLKMYDHGDLIKSAFLCSTHGILRALRLYESLWQKTLASPDRTMHVVVLLFFTKQPKKDFDDCFSFMMEVAEKHKELCGLLKLYDRKQKDLCYATERIQRIIMYLLHAFGGEVQFKDNFAVQIGVVQNFRLAGVVYGDQGDLMGRWLEYWAEEKHKFLTCRRDSSGTDYLDWENINLLSDKETFLRAIGWKNHFEHWSTRLVVCEEFSRLLSDVSRPVSERQTHRDLSLQNASRDLLSSDDWFRDLYAKTGIIGHLRLTKCDDARGAIAFSNYDNDDRALDDAPEEDSGNQPQKEERNDEDKPAKVESQAECVVCLDAKQECAIVPCGHVCICSECKDALADNRCPICRQPVASFLRVYTV